MGPVRTWVSKLQRPCGRLFFLGILAKFGSEVVSGKVSFAWKVSFVTAYFEAEVDVVCRWTSSFR